MRFRTLFLPACLSTLLLVGCIAKQGSRLHLNVCLQDDQGRPALQTLLREIALAEGMEFHDQSLLTEQAFAAMTEKGATGLPLSGIFIVSATDRKGLSFSATNMGLGDTQVSLTINENEAPEEQQTLSDKIITTFPENWFFEIVPEGKGALPMENCPQQNLHQTIAPPPHSETD